MKKTSMQNGLSTLWIILITVIVTAVLVGSGMYYLQMKNNTPEAQKMAPSPTPVSQGISLTDIDPTTAAEVNSNGRIEGTFIFPSEGIPKTLKACAENTKTAEVICSGTLQETGFNNTFSFEVPAAEYYVYSVNTTEDQQETRAYYTEFVTCGLLASCPSHEKIVVKVEKDQTVTDIKPHDWYDPSQMKIEE